MISCENDEESSRENIGKNTVNGLKNLHLSFLCVAGSYQGLNHCRVMNAINKDCVMLRIQQGEHGRKKKNIGTLHLTISINLNAILRTLQDVILRIY